MALASRVAELERRAHLRGGRTELARYFTGTEWDDCRDEAITSLLSTHMYVREVSTEHGPSMEITSYYPGFRSGPLVRMYVSVGLYNGIMGV
jgi:hypothetical protein